MANDDNTVVWHPNIHRFFGERLYYLLIWMERSPFISSTLTDFEKVHKMLESVGAFGHCIYPIFGDADIL